MSGQQYFEAHLPCDKAQISRFRKGLGDAGVEQLLKSTVGAAAPMGEVNKADLQRVIVSTTVQKKTIAYPNGTRLLEVVECHNYDVVPGSLYRLGMSSEICRASRRALLRCSQRDRMTWDTFNRIAKRFVPSSRNAHPFSEQTLLRVAYLSSPVCS